MNSEQPPSHRLPPEVRREAFDLPMTINRVKKGIAECLGISWVDVPAELPLYDLIAQTYEGDEGFTSLDVPELEIYLYEEFRLEGGALLREAVDQARPTITNSLQLTVRQIAETLVALYGDRPLA